MKRIAVAAIVAATALSAAVIGSTALAAAGGNSSDKAAAMTGAPVDTGSALAQLRGDPLSTYVKTRPTRGKKIDFNSSSVKAYRAQLAALRNDFKAWLRANAPRAKVTGEFDLSLNAVALELNGESLATVAASPLVQRAEYQGLYYPSTAGETADDPDLDLISAGAAWGAAGAANAGTGIKVAIIDSGVDHTHPCFNDEGYASQTQIGDRRFTNNKVIAAKVFNMRAGVRGYTPEAIDSHGTHVAGTVACNYGTPVTNTPAGVPVPHPISGVAPRALLGNYNVFPSDTGSARSEDILNAMDTAYADGFDITNMSLGGGSHGIQDLLTVAVDNLDLANMVVAVAAGNSGPGHFTVESPGSAARALTAGASSVGHLIATPISVGGDTFAGTEGDFATVSSDLVAFLSTVTEAPINSTTGLSIACTPLSADLTGTIALISRGVCSFSTKIRNAQAAGAVAVLVSNNVVGDAIGMASDGTPNQPTVIAYSVSLNDGLGLANHGGQSTTISATPAYFITGNDDFMGDFSSQGPTDVDFRVKPDVVAPGVNVLSSIPLSFCDGAPCFDFFQGTSMATPHLAGSAAIVRQQHPDWSAARVRSAIVNTADQGVLKRTNTPTIVLETDVNVIGAGRENLLSAVNAIVALDPVSVSFGAVPSGSGQSDEYVVTLIGTPGVNLGVTVDAGGGGVAYSVDSPLVTIGADGTAQVAVQMQAQKLATFGDHQATLRLWSGATEVAHAVLYTFIK